MLTRSPRPCPGPVAPIVTAASPVSTPARASRCPRADAGHRDELERGANRPLGIVLVRDGRAPDGHYGVADELLDVPPSRSTMVRARSK